jgi:RimJ/RimL family protein N-acetyltransferase
MERVGMTFEGFMREAMLVKGSYVTVGICSILRSEWMKRKKKTIE